MKNDPVIHAKASKIVEAIIDECDQNNLLIYDLNDKSIGFIRYRSILTEALASLESSEREVLEGFAELMNKEFSECELNVCIHPSHIDRYLAEKQSKTENK